MIKCAWTTFLFLLLIKCNLHNKKLVKLVASFFWLIALFCMQQRSARRPPPRARGHRRAAAALVLVRYSYTSYIPPDRKVLYKLHRGWWFHFCWRGQCVFVFGVPNGLIDMLNGIIIWLFLIFHHTSPTSAQKVLKMTFFEVYVLHQKRIKKKIIRSICTEKKSLQFDRRNSWLSSYWKCSYKKKILSGGFLTID